MLKAPLRVVASGTLLVGVPVALASEYEPSKTIDALVIGGLAWSGLNLVMYIRDLFTTTHQEANYDEDLAEAYMDGYVNAREDVGTLARDRERVIREFYEDKLTSVGDNVKSVTNHIINNDYSTTNNVIPQAVPQIEDNIIDTKLIGA